MLKWMFRQGGEKPSSTSSSASSTSSSATSSTPPPPLPPDSSAALHYPKPSSKRGQRRDPSRILKQQLGSLSESLITDSRDLCRLLVNDEHRRDVLWCAKAMATHDVAIANTEEYMRRLTKGLVKINNKLDGLLLDSKHILHIQGGTETAVVALTDIGSQVWACRLPKKGKTSRPVSGPRPVSDAPLGNVGVAAAFISQDIQWANSVLNRSISSDVDSESASQSASGVSVKADDDVAAPLSIPSDVSNALRNGIEDEIGHWLEHGSESTPSVGDG